MTLPSQFSLEEENFYKDIQDLVKKGSQNEKELSLFLERYKDLLAKADLDDETFIINFTKAGLIIEASAKVYGTKVDNLWVNLELVLDSIKNKSNQSNKKKTDCENDIDLDISGCDELNEDYKRKVPSSLRKKKKIGDAFFSCDDFFEIDNVTGLLDKNVNETENNCDTKIKLCEKVPTMFIKNKTKKKKVEISLNNFLDDKDIIRLRDWIISSEGLLMKEIYTKPLERIPFTANSDIIEATSKLGSEVTVERDDGVSFDNLFVEEDFCSRLKDEKNNNVDHEISEQPILEVPLLNEGPCLESNVSFSEEVNFSRESDLPKFPQVMERLSPHCLVDVDEVLWNPSKFQDVIPCKQMRAGKTNKLSCQLCLNKKFHKVKNKKCLEEKQIEGCLDSYFTPHLQLMLSEPQFGILPNEELFNIYKAEVKLIERLKKAGNFKNMNSSFYLENREELAKFQGFEDFENKIINKSETPVDPFPEDNLMFDDDEDDDDVNAEEIVTEKEIELPFPVTESSAKLSSLKIANNTSLKLNDDLIASESEYQKLVSEELKDHYAAKSSFAKSKELGIKISKWHEVIADKILLSEKRGALNMKFLADKIMNSFPTQLNSEKSVINFETLVKKKSRRDIPRYFFACLQLTNEGNLDISKSSSTFLATDCMVITRLRLKRANYELEDPNTASPYRENKPSRDTEKPIKRKRSLSNSSSIAENDILETRSNLKQKSKKNTKKSKKVVLHS